MRYTTLQAKTQLSKLLKAAQAGGRSDYYLGAGKDDGGAAGADGAEGRY